MSTPTPKTAAELADAQQRDVQRYAYRETDGKLYNIDANGDLVSAAADVAALDAKHQTMAEQTAATMMLYHSVEKLNDEQRGILGKIVQTVSNGFSSGTGTIANALAQGSPGAAEFKEKATQFGIDYDNVKNLPASMLKEAFSGDQSVYHSIVGLPTFSRKQAVAIGKSYASAMQVVEEGHAEVSWGNVLSGDFLQYFVAAVCYAWEHSKALFTGEQAHDFSYQMARRRDGADNAEAAREMKEMPIIGGVDAEKAAIVALGGDAKGANGASVALQPGANSSGAGSQVNTSDLPANVPPPENPLSLNEAEIRRKAIEEYVKTHPEAVVDDGSQTWAGVASLITPGGVAAVATTAAPVVLAAQPTVAMVRGMRDKHLSREYGNNNTHLKQMKVAEAEALRLEQEADKLKREADKYKKGTHWTDNKLVPGTTGEYARESKIDELRTKAKELREEAKEHRTEAKTHRTAVNENKALLKGDKELRLRVGEADRGVGFHPFRKLGRGIGSMFIWAGEKIESVEGKIENLTGQSNRTSAAGFLRKTRDTLIEKTRDIAAHAKDYVEGAGQGGAAATMAEPVAATVVRAEVAAVAKTAGYAGFSGLVTGFGERVMKIGTPGKVLGGLLVGTAAVAAAPASAAEYDAEHKNSKGVARVAGVGAVVAGKTGYSIADSLVGVHFWQDSKLSLGAKIAGTVASVQDAVSWGATSSTQQQDAINERNARHTVPLAAANDFLKAVPKHAVATQDPMLNKFFAECQQIAKSNLAPKEKLQQLQSAAQGYLAHDGSIAKAQQAIMAVAPETGLHMAAVASHLRAEHKQEAAQAKAQAVVFKGGARVQHTPTRADEQPNGGGLLASVGITKANMPGFLSAYLS